MQANGMQATSITGGDARSGLSSLLALERHSLLRVPNGEKKKKLF